MTDIITLTGLVATTPRHITTNEGLQITTFRLASSQRRYDRAHSKWIDGDTNWYTISTFRQLAANASLSVSKGDRVLVLGRVRLREWDNGERTGLNVDIEADAVGHDMTWGTSTFSRTIASSASQPSEVVAEDSASPVSDGSDAAQRPEVSSADSAGAFENTDAAAAQWAAAPLGSHWPIVAAAGAPLEDAVATPF